MPVQLNKFLEKKTMTSELANELCEYFIKETFQPHNIEDIEDVRYTQTFSKTKSRFGTSTLIDNEILSIEFHPAGDKIAYSRADGSLTVWLLGPDGTFASSKGRIYVTDIIGSEKLVTSISWNPTELNHFATASNTNEVHIWKTDEQKLDEVDLLFKLKTDSNKSKINKCIYDPTGRYLLAITKSECLYLYDVKNNYTLLSKSEIGELLGEHEAISSSCWDNSGNNIFLGLKKGILVLLTVDENNELCIKFKTNAHRSSIIALKMDPWGRFVVSASSDGTCLIWSSETLASTLSILSANSSIVSIDLDFLGKILAICTGDDTLSFYDVNSGKLLHSVAISHLRSDLVFKFYPTRFWYIVSSKDDILKNYFSLSGDPLKLWKNEFDKQLFESRRSKSSKSLSEEQQISRENKQGRIHKSIVSSQNNKKNSRPHRSVREQMKRNKQVQQQVQQQQQQKSSKRKSRFNN